MRESLLATVAGYALIVLSVAVAMLIDNTGNPWWLSLPLVLPLTIAGLFLVAYGIMALEDA